MIGLPAYSYVVLIHGYKLLCFQCHGPITHAIDYMSATTQNKHHRSVVGSTITLYFGVSGFEIHI
jgi:hypothetical protein